MQSAAAERGCGLKSKWPTGKDFIIGFQFHPEAAVVKHLQGAENADEFIDREAALLVFEALIAMLRQ